MVLPTLQVENKTPIITDFGPDPWDSLSARRARLFFFLFLLFFLFCAAFGATILLKGFVDFVALNFF